MLAIALSVLVTSKSAPPNVLVPSGSPMVHQGPATTGPMGQLSKSDITKLLIGLKAPVAQAFNGKVVLNVNHPLELGKVALELNGRISFIPQRNVLVVFGGTSVANAGELAVSFDPHITKGRYMIIVYGNAFRNSKAHIESSSGMTDADQPSGGFTIPIVETITSPNPGFVSLKFVGANNHADIEKVEIYPIE